MRPWLLLTAAIGLATGCRPLAPAHIPESKIVAVVGAKEITYGDLRSRVGAQLDRLQVKYLMDRRKLESSTLERLVESALLKKEARRQGITVRALLSREVDRKVAKPTEAAMKKLYQRARSRIAIPYKILKPRIAQALTIRARRRARGEYLERLRAQSGVKEMLPAMQLPTVEIPEAGNPARGPRDAPVKMVIFSDFQCPFCARVVPTLHQVLKRYPGKIRLVFRDFPLSFHEHAHRAAEAAMCANEQGKFWEYHDRLFDHQDRLGEKDLVEHARQLKLDAAALEKCLKSNKYKEEVDRDARAGSQLGVNGTPAVFVNGVMLSGAQPLSAFTSLIDSFLQAKAKKVRK